MTDAKSMVNEVASSIPSVGVCTSAAKGLWNIPSGDGSARGHASSNRGPSPCLFVMDIGVFS